MRPVRYHTAHSAALWAIVQITELEIIEGIERMTTAWRDEGAWLQKIDWKVKKDRLVLEEKNEVRTRHSTCRIRDSTMPKLHTRSTSMKC